MQPLDDSSKNPDRAILESPMAAVWANDPKRTLTIAELDRMLRHFGEFEKASESDLQSAINWLFGTFIDMATKERIRGSAGRLKQVPKPSTIVARQMQQVQKACENLDEQIAQLDPVTRTWLDQHFEEIGVKDESDHRVRLRDLEKRISWPIDQLIYAAHNAEGIASHGPSNIALRVMVEGMVDCWEKCHDRPPTTDKGRGRREDPFLELCQEMARIADSRLREKGGGLGSLKLSGLVADVLKIRPSRTRVTSREK